MEVTSFPMSASSKWLPHTGSTDFSVQTLSGSLPPSQKFPANSGMNSGWLRRYVRKAELLSVSDFISKRARRKDYYFFFFLNRCHNSQLFHREEFLFPLALIIFLSIRGLSHSHYSPLPSHQIKASLRFCSHFNGRNISCTEAELQDYSMGSLLICLQIPTS